MRTGFYFYRIYLGFIGFVFVLPISVFAVITGTSPNPAGDTLINENTVWDGENIILGGKTLIGDPGSEITVIWKDCNITAEEEIQVDQMYPHFDPVTLQIESTTITFDVPSDNPGFTVVGAYRGYSGYAYGSTLIALDSTFQGISPGIKSTGVRIYAYTETPVGLQLNNVTFKWLGGDTAYTGKRGALNAKAGELWMEGSYIKNCKFIECHTGVAYSDLLLDNCIWNDNWMPTIGVKFIKGGLVDKYNWGLYYSAADAIYEDVEIKNGEAGSYAFDQFSANNNAIIRNVYVHHGHNGIIIAGACGTLVEDSVIHDITGGVLYVQNPGSQRNVFRRNEAYNVGSGMYCAHGINNVWEENYIHDCTTGGISSGKKNIFRKNIIERCNVGINLQGETEYDYIGEHLIEENVFIDISDVEIDLFTSRFNIIRNQKTPVRVKSSGNVELRFEWTNLLPITRYVLKANNYPYEFAADFEGNGGIDIIHYTGLTTYTLEGLMPSTDAGNVLIYPNPYRADKNSSDKIAFANLCNGATIKIYTISGNLVETISYQGATDYGSKCWDISGIASGVYIYCIESAEGKKTGKVSIIK